MILRRATSYDAPALVNLYDIVWLKEVDILGEKLAGVRRADEETVQSWLNRNVYFIIEVKGSVVAAIGCEEKQGTLHLVHLVTHPDYRRQGYAKILMEKAEAHAREIGANKLWFDTAPELDAAKKLYEKLGYKMCG